MAKSDSICDACFRGDTESEGVSFCSDCEEILCLNCDKAHRVGKLTLNHLITEIQHLPKVPDETVKNVWFCEKHSENNVELYCNLHDILCCKTCMVEDHRTCDKLDVIDDISANIRSSSLVEDISKAISSLLLTYDAVIENRAQVKDSICQGEAKLIESIAKLKTCLIKRAELLETELLSEMRKQREETVSTLERETEEMIHSRSNMQMIQKEFDFNINYGSKKKLFILAEKLKHVLVTKEDHIQSILSGIENVSFDFAEKDNIAEIICSLAKICLTRTHCNIKHSFNMQKSPQFAYSLLSLNPTAPLNILCTDNLAIPCIANTEDGRLLLCNFYGNAILVFKEDCSFIKKRHLKSGPYQIGLHTSECQAAVTMPKVHTIIFLNTDSLKTIHEIETEKKYRAIQYMDDNWFAGGLDVIDVIKMDGTVIRSISVPTKGLVRYISKGPNDTLLYTNSSHLFCIKLIDGTQVFEYTESIEARGIAVDKNGCIYLADRNQRNIQRISRDGSFTDIVLENCEPPIALCFNCDCSRLYVGFDGVKFVATFQCQ